jgi:hypothetical protein
MPDPDVARTWADLLRRPGRHEILEEIRDVDERLRAALGAVSPTEAARERMVDTLLERRFRAMKELGIA